MASSSHDVYLVDYRLPGRSGLDLVREASARGCAAPMLILTGVGDREVDLQAMKAGAADYLDKGRLDEVILERAIRHAIERKRAADDLRQLKKAVDTLQIGLSITDVTGRIVYTNPAEAEMHGFTGRGAAAQRGSGPLPPDGLAAPQPGAPPRVPAMEAGAHAPAQGRQRSSPCGCSPTWWWTRRAGRWGSSRCARTSPSASGRRRRCARARSATPWPCAAPTTASGTGTWSPTGSTTRRAGRPSSASRRRRWATLPRSGWAASIPTTSTRVRAKLADHREGRTPLFEDEHRIRHKDGNYRWVLSRGLRRARRLGPRLPHGGRADRRHRPPGLRLPDRAAQPRAASWSGWGRPPAAPGGAASTATRCSSSTSTASRPSTTPWATWRATRC